MQTLEVFIHELLRDACSCSAVMQVGQSSAEFHLEQNGKLTRSSTVDSILHTVVPSFFKQRKLSLSHHLRIKNFLASPERKKRLNTNSFSYTWQNMYTTQWNSVAVAHKIVVSNARGTLLKAFARWGHFAAMNFFGPLPKKSNSYK